MAFQDSPIGIFKVDSYNSRYTSGDDNLALIDKTDGTIVQFTKRMWKNTQFLMELKQ